MIVGCAELMSGLPERSSSARYRLVYVTGTVADSSAMLYSSAVSAASVIRVPTRLPSKYRFTQISK